MVQHILQALPQQEILISVQRSERCIHSFTTFFQPSKIFRLIIQERIVRKNCVSVRNSLYCFIDKYGAVINMKDDTKATVYIDALTDEIYIERYNRYYTAYKLGERKRSSAEVTENRKEYNELLDSCRRSTVDNL